MRNKNHKHKCKCSTCEAGGLDKLQREERKNPTMPWFLSFATEKGFHGGIIVCARGIVDAISIAHRLDKISSQSNVRGFPIPGSAYSVPDEKYFFHKMKMEEIQEFWPDMKVASGKTDYYAA